MTTLKFSIAKKSIPVVLEDEKGVEIAYSLREMTGDQLAEYSKAASLKVSTDKEGNVSEIKDYKGIYSLLLSFTLYDAHDKLVPESVIESWPHSVQKALQEEASKINGFKDADPKKD
jgi:hypothetical protein